MTKAKHSGAFKGHRFPPEFITYAVWSYFRFPLSLRDVEDLFAARGIIVSYETIRKWVGKFGTKYAASIRQDRPAPSDKWHLDEVVIPIRGRKFWLWRAIDSNGDVLDILVQSRRNTRTAKRFFRKLFKEYGRPRVVITDKLCGYSGALKSLTLGIDHRRHKGLNNRSEGTVRQNYLRRAGLFVTSPNDKTPCISLHETWPGVTAHSCVGPWTGNQEPRTLDHAPKT